ncbi:MAG TPA: hypothetical protein VGC78_00470 [Gaiellaceae bacterium]|jgi:hypothetical protein
MRIFKRQDDVRQTSWAVDVDYGEGWFRYGPPLPAKEAAEALARDLHRHGHEVRVVAADDVPVRMRTPAASRSRRRVRHGRPRG